MGILEDHPGYLGLTSEGLELIHADWPAYPLGHGRQYALSNLGQFPPGMVLRGIDEIDRCFLLVAGPAPDDKDPFDQRFLHVAIWNEDLVDLYRQGMVEGRGGLSHEDWAQRRLKELTEFALYHSAKTGRPAFLPDENGFEEEEGIRGLVMSEGITVTSRGITALTDYAASSKNAILARLPDGVTDQVALGRLDTAVREACVTLEHRLRSAVESGKYGQSLVEHFILELESTRRFVSARLKVFRVELRSLFRFVRNEFMHNLKTLEEPQCLMFLERVGRALASVEQARRSI